MTVFAQPTLRLGAQQYATIIASCYDGLPNEACGLFIGPVSGDEPTGVVVEAVACRNAEESAVIYTIDGRDLIRAQRRADEQGLELVGCWHSHTHTDPYPSPTDVEAARWYPTWLYGIVSLRDDAPMLRAFRIRDGQIAEIEVDQIPGSSGGNLDL